MARIKVSNLPPASTLSGSEIVPLVQDGETRQATLDLVATTIRGAQGPAGPPGQSIVGPPGPASTVPGPQGPAGTNGVGVPAGGQLGQVLTKQSGSDHDTVWLNPTGGSGGGAVASVNGQIGTVVLTATDVGAATTAQGTLANTATQPADVIAAIEAHVANPDPHTQYATTAEVPALAPIQSLVAGTNIAINTIDARNPVISATVPAGPPGPQGIQGIQGIQGTAGEDGADAVWVELTQAQYDAITPSPTILYIITATGGSGGNQGPAYGFYRLVVDETWDSQSAHITNLQFRTTAGGVAQTGTPIFSTEDGAGSTAAMAFDADPTTWWTNAIADPLPFVGLDLPADVTVVQVSLMFPAVEPAYYSSSLKSFRIQGSANGTTWTTVRTVTNAPEWNPGEVREYTI